VYTQYTYGICTYCLTWCYTHTHTHKYKVSYYFIVDFMDVHFQMKRAKSAKKKSIEESIEEIPTWQ